MSHKDITPPIRTIVVKTPEGKRELLLHDDMEIVRKAGIMHIVKGERVTPIPAIFNPYQTQNKIFLHNNDGQLYKLADRSNKGFDTHPNVIDENFIEPVQTQNAHFLDFEFCEIQIN